MCLSIDFVEFSVFFLNGMFGRLVMVTNLLQDCGGYVILLICLLS